MNRTGLVIALTVGVAAMVVTMTIEGRELFVPVMTVNPTRSASRSSGTSPIILGRINAAGAN